MTTTPPNTTIVELPIEPLTAEGFAPFGTVIAPSDDGAPFGPDDAVLALDQGTPRFYTMQIPGRGLLVQKITRHRRVTQVLAAAGGHDWVVGVAPPLAVDEPDAAPALDAIKAFRIPGDTAVMLAVGTWHAGPLFEGEPRAFFNLELSDTNVVDHHTCNLVETYATALHLI
ncbi:MAG: ureidoglycolate lyase [Actinomycetota bacterium]